MTKIFNTFKKSPVFSTFLVHFPNGFLRGGGYFWKIWLSHTTLYGFLAPCQNLKKLMIQFQENAWTVEG